MQDSTPLDDTGKPEFASAIDSAIGMPNIDGRPSVFTELPDIFVEGGMEGVAEKAITLSVRWGKPHDQERVRCHPDPERIRRVMAIKDKTNRGRLWIIPAQLLQHVPGMAKPYVIRQAVNQNGESLLWPAPLPCEREAPSDASHREAQHRACKSWIRLEWTGNAYAGREPEADYGVPKWPDEPFQEILHLGLRDNIITDLQHPLLKLIIGR